MAKKNWWPTTLSAQVALMTNFQSKIASYTVPLALTPAQVALAEGLCDAIIGSMTFHESCKNTMLAATQWRDLVLYGEPRGDAVPNTPAFPASGVSPYTRGSVDQFFAFREMIVASPNYTESIGEDLGIVGAEVTPEPESEFTPSLSVTTIVGYKVSLSGSLQGRDAMRVEYQRNGGAWTTVAFITKLPAEVSITPQTPGEPESGSIRAIFIEENEPFGNLSPSYPVVLS